MGESLLPEVVGASPLKLELELKGNQLEVWGRNRGVHSLKVVSLVVLRRLASGSELRKHVGEGGDVPFESEDTVIPANERRKLVSLREDTQLTSAQAFARHIEESIEGFSLSADKVFETQS